MTRMHGLAIAGLLATLSACGGYDPDPHVHVAARAADATPECMRYTGLDRDAVAAIVATLERNDDIQRTDAAFAMLRPVVEARLAKADPAAPSRLKPALDALFSPATLDAATICGFNRYGQAQPMFEAMEEMSNDARMRAIHAAVLDLSQPPTPEPLADSSVDSAPTLAPERRRILERVAAATELRSHLLGFYRLEKNTVATVDAAIDPTSSMSIDLRMNGKDVEALDDATVVDMLLSSRLADVPDEDLQRFLAFAESNSGRTYYRALAERYAVGGRDWLERLATALNNGVHRADVARNPAEAEKLYAEALRLYEQVGTRVVFPEARTLALRAGRLDPDNARIQVLLGRMALRTVPSTAPVDASGIRSLVDRMHPATPERYAEAERYLARAIELDPENAQAYLYQGRIQFELSNDADAERLYARSRELDPNGHNLEFYEADFDFARGKYGAAERRYRHLLSIPEAQAYDHHYAIERLRLMMTKQGRSAEFNAIAAAQLKRQPDMWDFRLEYAEWLLGTGGSIADVAAILDPVPDHWVPDLKRRLQVRLQLLRVSEATTAARAQALQRAFALADGPMSVVEATCASRNRTQIAREVIAASGQRNAAADRLLACAIWSDDGAFLSEVLSQIDDIDRPNTALEGRTPLCAVGSTAKARTFAAILKARPKLDLRCADGKTVREQLQQRASDATMDATYRNTAREMLDVMGGAEHAR